MSVASEPEPEADSRAAARARREAQAREALLPLAEDERPRALLVAVAVCVLVALTVAVAGLTDHNLSKHGGSQPGAIFLAVVFLALARGMYLRRYWAVLGFEAILTFQIIATCLAMVLAETLLAAGACVLAIGLGGWLFWKLVRVMGRIQAGERHDGARTG